MILYVRGKKNTHQQTGSCEEAARSDSIMDLM